MTREDQIVFRICNKGNLPDHHEIVTGLVCMIHRSGIRISCSDVCDTSVLLRAHLHGEPDRMVLGFKYVRSNHLHILWEMLRLLGCHMAGMSGEPVSAELEHRAWKFALCEWDKHPEWHKLNLGLFEYMQQCLGHYAMETGKKY